MSASTNSPTGKGLQHVQTFLPQGNQMTHCAAVLPVWSVINRLIKKQFSLLLCLCLWPDHALMDLSFNFLQWHELLDTTNGVSSFPVKCLENNGTATTWIGFLWICIPVSGFSLRILTIDLIQAQLYSSPSLFSFKCFSLLFVSHSLSL